MARVYDNWERLVKAVLRSEQRGGHQRTPSGIAGAVPDSLQRTTNINAILQAADEIQSEDPNVARILCEQAYTMAQNLDPNSDGRGVLQFKTGLMSVIKQKLAKKDGGRIDRNRDIERLWEFYHQYKRQHRKRIEHIFLAGLYICLQLRFSEMKKVFATLRALVEVMEALSKDAAPDGVGRLITEELRRIKKSDATISAELIPYNIVPLEAPSLTNAIGYFPEVRGAISAIRYNEQFPRLPADFEISGQRDLDMFDLLEYVFGFQKDNIRNQREHLILALANAQSRLGIPADADPKLDERAVRDVFLKVLDNYIKWCRYLRIRLVWNSLEAINKDRKLFLVSLYFCIWAKPQTPASFLNASAIYFTTYVFNISMARELDAILDHGEATHATSCISENGSVSFLEQIICPIYKILAETSHDNNKAYAAMFSPFWNEIIRSLREEDFISNREMDLLSMPSNTGSLKLVQWPLFLLSSKILLAIDLALDCKDTQADLWSRICKDEYMAYAVQECYSSIEKILHSLVDGEGRLWVERIFREINSSISEGSLVITLSLKKLQVVLSRFTALTGLLTRDPTPELAKGAAKAVYDFYDVVTHELLSSDLREQLDTWHILLRARNEGRLFSRIEWPKDPDIKEQVKRLHLLLTVKDSAANIPKNLEARRRLEFFTNSLFMDMPPAKPVCEMMPFCVFTPYYSETVLYSNSELRVENEDGISILFYLQKIFPDEWENFLQRIGHGDGGDAEFQETSTNALELRFWASYRGQTLARTVRGMMYYRRALMLQSYLERRSLEEDVSYHTSFTTQGFELSREARAQADIKFTYVVSCQIYGQQKQRKAPEAADIALLLQRNEALRVAFIHVEESGAADGKVTKEFYSKLVKADEHGKDQEIFSIKLPGDPKLGEGKPENQNHAIIFTRGEAVQTIDMNQDNYLEEAMKMRNLLEEFRGNHGLRPPTILGVREHVFTGSVSSLAWFMSNQETSFVTLGQRVLAKPLKVRMHYGHPDVFDRIFHVTRGGISKASRVINISEDIYAGMECLEEGRSADTVNKAHNIACNKHGWKGRDVGLNQIALFEGKVAGGNGEQVLSRDVYRLGQLFDFFRMLSFFFTTVGYYVCTMMTVLTIYVFLYGRAYLAFSGLDKGISREAKLLGNTAFDAVLNAQFLAVFSFITMQLQLCSVFFTFSLGTRTHYFGRTILHGGAKYRATGRGFVVRHIKFAENYRLYSRSHFVKALEVALLLIVCIAYGYSEGGAVSFILLTISSWFLVISWLFAPYIFNPSGFEWQKTVEDFDDWTNWLMYKGGVGVKGDNSWESWWDEEQMHIQTLRGRILETILSLRFIMFQYGIVYKLHATGNDTSIAVYGFSWVVLVGIVLIFKIFTFSPKKSTNFQLMLRFIQGATAIGLIVALCLVVLFTSLTVADLFASILAFIPTGWLILSLAITWKKIVRSLGLWESVKEFARMYDAGMGILIFAPIAVLSWFPFVSTFQSRLLFNQAFSRGLEISLILAGNKANVEANSF
ncbi:Callose synthase 10 [Sesamum angolense]|uniref:Callose synthase 10 n=1 Tax=Sesamum angolense TaxID=2727404 RepID=A0AAE1WLQ5_9LAMI|nr:Callose synthase 10 [Sesamum angolense]